MSDTGPRVIAHAGFAGIAPENSLGAFRAIADGTHPAEMVEIDVMPCADGTPVVFHDDHLDAVDGSRGITDVAGVVWETPLEEVVTARILDTEETVPTLEDALDTLVPTVGVNIELKNPGTFDVRPGEALNPAQIDRRRERWDPFVERVIDVIDGTGGDFLLSSFHEPALAAVRDRAPEMPLGTLVGTSAEDSVSVTERYDCTAIHPTVEAIVPRIAVDASEQPDPSPEVDVLARADDLGCDVNVWTVRTWHEADRLSAAGVDGLIADYPNLRRWT